MQRKYSKKFYIILVLILTLAFSTKALASLTFSSSAITGTTASTIDVGSGNALSLQTVGNGNIITGSGNFGINTASPSAKLEIDNPSTGTGPELITNGTFTGSASGWTLGNNVTYNAGTNNVTSTYAGGDATFSTTFASVAGNTYILTLTMTGANSPLGITIINDGLYPPTGPFNSNNNDGQTFTLVFPTDFTGTETLIFQVWNSTTVGATITLDNVSIKQTISSSAFKVVGNNGVTWLSLGGDMSGSTALGNGALFSNTQIGSGNTAIGDSALYLNVDGFYNTATGQDALYTSTSGQYNTANGMSALRDNTTGNQNTGVGAFALGNNLTGSFSTALGSEALGHNRLANSSTAVGESAARGAFVGYSNQGGAYFGYRAGFSAATGSDYNTLLGYKSGYGVTTGARNVFLGNSTIAASYGQITTGSNNISIGNDVAVASATASNQLNIGNLIYGTGLDGTGATISTGNIGIGTKAPSAPLEVKGSGTGATIAKFTDVNTTGCTIATGGTIACSSDVNLKKNIEDINYGLDTLMQLRPVLYNWKYEDDGSVKSLGFIAQEVEAIIPKLVSTDEAGIKSLNTTGIVPVLAKAIQEMNLKIDLVASTVIPNSGSSLDSFASTFFENVFSRVRTYLGDVSNGIGDFFANRVHTKELCVAKADGTEFCANGDQFQAMAVTLPTPAPVVPTCVAPQILVNNVCTDPAPVVPTCVAPQTLVNNVCTDPAPVVPTCVAPQTLVNNICTDPALIVPTCVDPQILVDNICVDPTPTR